MCASCQESLLLRKGRKVAVLGHLAPNMAQTTITAADFSNSVSQMCSASISFQTGPRLRQHSSTKRDLAGAPCTSIQLQNAYSHAHLAPACCSHALYQHPSSKACTVHGHRHLTSTLQRHLPAAPCNSSSTQAPKRTQPYTFGCGRLQWHQHPVPKVPQAPFPKFEVRTPIAQKMGN